MTKGKIIPSILSFCLPLLIGNIFQQFYNMADSIIVGKFIGVNALAAVGSTGSINFLVIGFVLGICSGFCIPVSQRFGAGDIKDMRRYIANGIYLSFFIVIILTTLTMIFTRQILELMNTPEDIIDDAYSYIIVIFAGIAVIVLYNYLASLLRALGDSKTPLYFLIIASLINVGLDIFFILGLDLGVFGVGLATVIAQAISGLLCLFFTSKNFSILRFEKDELKFSPMHCKKLLSIGVPMALQFSITAVGSIIMQTAVNGLGTNAVAAITASNRISMLMTQPMETIGITMATFCGQNIGANNVTRARKGVSVALRMVTVYCVFAGIVLWFFGNFLAKIFISADELVILDNVAYTLKIFGVTYPVLGVLFILRNSLQGMGFSFLPMCAGISELIARALVAFLLVDLLGFTAACLSGPVAWLFAVILLVPAYFVCMKKLNSK